ncbi:MAG: 1,4-dihydroxy-2-naphthoate polyprenyltransferase [Ekhidna sp.]
MATVKNWITAFRLRTLPLAFAGWLVGTVLVIGQGQVHVPIAALTLATAFLLQILSNLANDYGDAVSGVDSDKRDGPQRMVQSGAISKKAMGGAVIVFSLFSLICGVLLLALAFPDDFFTALIFLTIGLLAIAAAIKYTVGKNPYGYVGFGDLFVFVFFGLVLVFGTYFLQVQSIDWEVLLPAATVGCFSIGVLNVNNIRDIESDKASGKQSIPVRLGREKAVIYHVLLLFGGVLCALIFVLLDFRNAWQLLFIMVLIPLVINIKAVKYVPVSNLDPYLKQMAISTLLFALLFSIGHYLSWFFS